MGFVALRRRGRQAQTFVASEDNIAEIKTKDTEPEFIPIMAENAGAMDVEESDKEGRWQRH